jgi:rare lipoprotein A (peptidoglycan hydrolase)
MRPKAKLPLRSKLHVFRPARALCTLLALCTTAGGLLAAAPGSQALLQRGHRAASSATRHPDYHRGVASWYYDDGHGTACGFHAKYGVANRRLKCGTHVKFIHRGHRVRAVVDDRGPYVAGRKWDLDEHTRRALHLRGVGTVWAKW